MIDTHCHIDAYPDPLGAAVAADRARVFTVAVTNTPSAFERAFPHVRPLRSLRLAVGMHPLLVASHALDRQRARFAACLSRTSYVGEVGLDFSRQGQTTRAEQLELFRFVLRLLRQQPKFVSVHSRRAETATLDLLEECSVGPVVLHWFSGSPAQLRRLLALGHLCSVNPAMLRTAGGRAVIDSLPRDRVLTETDGPFVTVAGRAAEPGDVAEVERYLAALWETEVLEVRRQIEQNLRRVLDATFGCELSGGPPAPGN